MRDLFKVQTDRISLTWSLRRDDPVFPAYSSLAPPPGQLRVSPRRNGIVFLADNWRVGVPDEVTGDWQQCVGPRLYEEKDYVFHLHAKTGQTISFTNRDPALIRANEHKESNSIHGIINFGSQVGLTLFSVALDGMPEFDFEVEVFPTKIDYVSDYEQLTAEIQDISTGLALEYLKSTFKLGLSSTDAHSSLLEWAIFLKHAINDLEQAVAYISRHPHWNIEREAETVRADRLKRTDASVRRAILRGAGSGRFIREGLKFACREKISERTPHSTLDTPEHRWLAHQLRGIRRRLSQILLEQMDTSKDAKMGSAWKDRQARVRKEILDLEQRIARLSQTEPLNSVGAVPPPNYASMKLLGAPGYREAYRAILMLSLGLRLTGGPVQMSLKDLSLLYEYWCFISVLGTVSSLVGTEVPVNSLIRPEQNGLRVALQRGRETKVTFRLQNGRQIEVIYNPQFKGDQSFLVPQQPDILLTIEDPSWPALHIVLDAKYRLDNSPETVSRYRSPGPPQDALNVLHRYRDAIVETETSSGKLKRTIVEAAALFPYRELQSGSFRESRLWRSLERIGVGAIPMLPNGTGYFREYLSRLLIKGGWALADLPLGHRSLERSADWRQAASKPVLVAVLKPGYEAEHLAWIERERTYYMPMLRRQSRQYQVSSIRLFSPSALRNPGAITHVAEVQSVELLSRKGIKTPWAFSRDGDQMQVVYRLGVLRALSKPIHFRAGSNLGLRRPRWTSELGAARAATMNELILETEPEWRLYENLQLAGMEFDVRADSPELENPDDPQGRAWFNVGSVFVQFRGSAGFLIRKLGFLDKYVPSAEAVIAFLSTI
jgi:predicted component of viral defense system (DUF524 family)